MPSDHNIIMQSRCLSPCPRFPGSPEAERLAVSGLGVEMGLRTPPRFGIYHLDHGAKSRVKFSAVLLCSLFTAFLWKYHHPFLPSGKE